jgi:hypothetical protein
MKAKQWVEPNIFQLAFPGAKVSVRFMYYSCHLSIPQLLQEGIQCAAADFLVVKISQPRLVSSVCEPFTLQKQQLSYNCHKITHEPGHGPA